MNNPTVQQAFFAESKRLLLDFFADNDVEQRAKQRQMGAAVRCWRCEKGLSPDVFAQELGISKAQLLAFEYGALLADQLPLAARERIQTLAAI